MPFYIILNFLFVLCQGNSQPLQGIPTPTLGTTARRSQLIHTNELLCVLLHLNKSNKDAYELIIALLDSCWSNHLLDYELLNVYRTLN